MGREREREGGREGGKNGDGGGGEPTLARRASDKQRKKSRYAKPCLRAEQLKKKIYAFN